MYHHPIVLMKLAHERQNDLLREAETCRLVRQIERGHPAEATLLKRIAGALDRLLNDPKRRAVDRDPFAADRAVAD